MLASLYHTEECHLSYAPSVNDSILQYLNSCNYSSVDGSSTITNQIPTTNSNGSGQTQHLEMNMMPICKSETLDCSNNNVRLRDFQSVCPHCISQHCFHQSKNDACISDELYLENKANNIPSIIDHYFWLGMIDWVRMKQCTEEFVDRNGCTYEIMDLAKTNCLSPFDNFEQFKTVGDNLSIANELINREDLCKCENPHMSFRWHQKNKHPVMGAPKPHADYVNSFVMDKPLGNMNRVQHLQQLLSPHTQGSISIIARAQNEVCTCEKNGNEIAQPILTNDEHTSHSWDQKESKIKNQNPLNQTNRFMSTISHRFKTISNIAPAPTSLNNCENKCSGDGAASMSNIRVISSLHMKDAVGKKPVRGDFNIYSKVWNYDQLPRNSPLCKANTIEKVSSTSEKRQSTPTTSENTCQAMNNDEISSRYDKLYSCHSRIRQMSTTRYRKFDVQKPHRSTTASNTENHTRDSRFDLPPKPKLIPNKNITTNCDLSSTTKKHAQDNEQSKVENEDQCTANKAISHAYIKLRVIESLSSGSERSFNLNKIRKIRVR